MIMMPKKVYAPGEYKEVKYVQHLQLLDDFGGLVFVFLNPVRLQNVANMYLIVAQNKSFFAFAYKNIQEKKGASSKILKEQHLHSYNDSY